MPPYGTGFTEFEGSWDYYNGTRANIHQNPALSSVGNLQLHWGSSESVKLDPLVEFETFFTTSSTGVGGQMQYYDEVFERENAFTHRNFKENDNQPFAIDEAPKQCHNFLGIWSTTYEPLPVHADMFEPNSDTMKEPPMGYNAGFSNVFGIKIREQYFPATAPPQ